MSEQFNYMVGKNADNDSICHNKSQRKAIVLLCRNALVSIGLKHLLEGTCFFITDSESDEGSFSHRHSCTSPKLFIIDGSDAPGYIVDTAKALKNRYPEARIALIADGFDLGFVKLARSAGIDGFCLSTNDREVLIRGLEMIILGETVLPTYLMALLLEAVPALEPKDSRAEGELERSDSRPGKLSTRESQILHCLTEGAPNKIIARKLDVAEATVKVHVKAILRKIGASNRTQAAMWATAHLPTNVGSSLRG
jgi:two-component system nitrate/nitrite response regulator NarL